LEEIFTPRVVLAGTWVGERSTGLESGSMSTVRRASLHSDSQSFVWCFVPKHKRHATTIVHQVEKYCDKFTSRAERLWKI